MPKYKNELSRVLNVILAHLHNDDPVEAESTILNLADNYPENSNELTKIEDEIVRGSPEKAETMIEALIQTLEG